MASIYTHYKFSEDVLKKINKDILCSLSEEKRYYHIFSQSFDYLYSYKFYYFLKINDVQRLSNKAHTTNVNLYFFNIINYMIENNQENNPYLREYLFASLNHYILDKLTHPFIMYKTGFYSSKDEKKLKYNGLRSQIQFMFDAYLYNKETNKNYKDYKISKELFIKIKFNQDIIKCIDEVYLKTFNVEDGAKLYKKCYSYGKWSFKIAIEDKYGIKRKIKTWYDVKNKNMKPSVRYKTNNFDYINEELFNFSRKEWCNPCDNRITSTDSMLDIYNKALIEAVHIIEKTDLVLKKSMDMKEYLELLGNKSYKTGLDCENTYEYKYFEF